MNLREKWKNWKNGEKMNEIRIKGMKITGIRKNQWLLLLLAGLLLLVIAMPAGKKETKSSAKQEQKTEKETMAETGQNDYKEQLEEQLTALLEQIEGVGEAKVMITLEDTGKKEVEKDENREQSRTSGENAQESSSVSTQTVYEEAQEGAPYISNEKYPEIKGVCIVAQGGGNSKTKQEILGAVQALFGIDANKILVVKMRIQEES